MQVMQVSFFCDPNELWDGPPVAIGCHSPYYSHTTPMFRPGKRMGDSADSHDGFYGSKSFDGEPGGVRYCINLAR